MPETIVLTVSAEVSSGPKIAETRVLSVDAYDKLSVTVAAGAADRAVDIQPGGTGSIRLLLVTSSAYGTDVKYTINADTTDHVLDEPHVLVGTGSVALYGAEPTRLVFDNQSGEDVQIGILVGRTATS